jgi:hypothetical protein
MEESRDFGTHITGPGKGRVKSTEFKFEICRRDPSGDVDPSGDANPAVIIILKRGEGLKKDEIKGPVTRDSIN